jgi:C-terminal processing protease CtpA/Prc
MFTAHVRAQDKGHTGLLFRQDSVRVDDRYAYTIVVGEIVSNSPASKTDIRKGDKLISVNGIQAGQDRVDIDLVNRLMLGIAHTSISVEIERSEVQKKVTRMTYMLEHNPAVRLPKERVYGIGVTLSLDSIILDNQLIYTAQVTGIYPNSPAEKAGINPGDYVFEVDGIRIEGKSLQIINAVVDRLLIDEPNDVDVGFLRLENEKYQILTHHMQRINISPYMRNQIQPIRTLVKTVEPIPASLNENALENQHDRDKDGIDDEDDACPDEKGVYSVNPFENGCPE